MEKNFRAYTLRNEFTIKSQLTQNHVKVDKIYARMYGCRLSGKNKVKSDVGEDEIWLCTNKAFFLKVVVKLGYMLWIKKILRDNVNWVRI